MTQAKGQRRGHGEDSIYWDSSKHRYVGAVSLGFAPAGTRIRRKVTGRTKAEVRGKPRELHKEVDSGLRPKHAYTVNDALDDWLAHGLDSVSARTVTLYKGTIVPLLREQLGAAKLSGLTAGDVQNALMAIAARMSTRTAPPRNSPRRRSVPAQPYAAWLATCLPPRRSRFGLISASSTWIPMWPYRYFKG